jgi:hypothetical protein
MPLRACTVTIHDLNDVAHSLEVTAGTLYEAVAQALAVMRGDEWVGEIGKGLTEVTVRVKEPEAVHTVRMSDFEKWLDRQGRTPAEAGGRLVSARASRNRDRDLARASAGQR